jgi:hypothetical protein
MRDLAEGHARRPSLSLRALTVRDVGDVLGHEMSCGHVRAALVEGVFRNPSATSTPPACAVIWLEPSGTDSTLDLNAVVAELGLVEVLFAMLTDDDRGAGFLRGNDVPFSAMDSPASAGLGP